MQHKKNQMSVSMMVQRCHKWRQRRKQFIDKARQTTDEIERERLLQSAEHYGRIVNGEQAKIDTKRGGGASDLPPIETDADEDFQDFKNS
jgi:hypothetical protein